MNVFAKACNVFVREEGKNSMHATLSPDEVTRVKLYQVVQKSKPPKFLPWLKTDFRPSGCELKDMLIDGKDLEGKPKTTELAEFTSYHLKLSLGGNIAATFCKIIDGNLIGRYNSKWTITFGKPMKNELNEQTLSNELKNRRINMGHHIVRPIQGDKRKSLCLITGVAFLPDGGNIHRTTSAKLTANANASIPGMPAAEVGASARVEYDKYGGMNLPKGTAVAFKVQELDIDITTGAVQLALTGGWSGGGSRVGTEDEESQLDSALHFVRDAFAPLIKYNSKRREEVNRNLLTIMKDRDDLGYIARMLMRVEKKGVDADISVREVEQIVKSPRAVWQYVLKLAGLSVKDGMFITTKYKSHKAQMVASIFRSTLQLNQQYKGALVDLATFLSPSNAKNIIKVLEYGFNKKPVTGIVDKVLSDATSIQILNELGYICTSMDGRNNISPPAKMHSYMISLYLLVFALYGK